jgi:hypothetical protein
VEELRRLVAAIRRLLWSMTGVVTAVLALAWAVASFVTFVTG